MITERINKWVCESLPEAVTKTEGFLAAGLKAWRVDCVVYWIEDSTD